MIKIALVPLDDRPCNLKFPVQIGQIAGMEVITPPKEFLGKFTTPGTSEAISDWLKEIAPEVSALVISLDMLIYGGFLASRTGGLSLEEALKRIEVIPEIKLKYPKLPIYLSSIILRSGVTDTEIRERNHEVNKRAIELAGFEEVNFLILGKDDIGEEGIPKNEILTLKGLIEEFSCRRESPATILCGADELGLMLIVRRVLEEKNLTPKIFLKYSTPAGPEVVALYEDEPIVETITRHIRALKGRVVEDEKGADLILFVNTPEVSQRDLFFEEPYKGRDLNEFVKEIKEALDRGRKVAVADMAYANGADPDLIPLLKAKVDIRKLVSFAAWNTAGNTSGTVLAQALVPRKNEKIHLESLLSRFIDDYFYQTLVRKEIFKNLREKPVSPADLGEHWAEIEWIVKKDLGEQADSFLREFRISNFEFRISLPWPRIFEVEVELKLK